MSEDPSKTLFAKFANGTIKVDPVYEDKSVFAFNDINPQAPTHVLIIPKTLAIGKLEDTSDSDAATLGTLMVAAGKIATQLKLTSGYRLVVNSGKDGCQSINYLHVHLLAGRKLKWPPG